MTATLLQPSVIFSVSSPLENQQVFHYVTKKNHYDGKHRHV